jgi:hypothetical protein
MPLSNDDIVNLIKYQNKLVDENIKVIYGDSKKSTSFIEVWETNNDKIDWE